MPKMTMMSKAARTVLSCCKSGASTAISLCSNSVQLRFLSFMVPRFGEPYHPRARVKTAARFRRSAFMELEFWGVTRSRVRLIE